MASRSAQDHYSDKCEESGDNIEETDDDRAFLAEFTPERIQELEREGYASEIGPIPPDEIARMVADLGASVGPDDLAAPDTVALVADWLADVRELARKHGPFAPWQIVQVIRELNTPADGASR